MGEETTEAVAPATPTWKDATAAFLDKLAGNQTIAPHIAEVIKAALAHEA
jgi:hypothetical protein